MPTKDELQQAIASLEQQEPSYETCHKLVVYHQMMDRYYKGIQTTLDSETEFVLALQGKNIDNIIAVFDDLMNCLAVINPKLYDNVMAKLRG